jgi:hypothetical protein
MVFRSGSRSVTVGHRDERGRDLENHVGRCFSRSGPKTLRIDSAGRSPIARCLLDVSSAARITGSVFKQAEDLSVTHFGGPDPADRVLR